MTDTLSGRCAANIRAELARRGWTQADLAVHLGMDRVHLNKRLNGHTEFRLNEVDQIAGALSVEPSKLLND